MKSDVLYRRIWAMPNSNTFQIVPIRQLLERYCSSGLIIVDPFANNSKLGSITNDLNPEYDTTFHMEALEFLKMLDPNMADIVLYDPPYSLRQISECYKSVGIEVTKEKTQSSWKSAHCKEIQRITKQNGLCISFGWSSGGIGLKYGFEIIEGLLVPHGGSHYDTICTVERKVTE